MPRRYYYKNEYERPLVVWIAQISILLNCTGIVLAIASNAWLCVVGDPFLIEGINNCWVQLVLPQLWPKLIALSIWLSLFYGLERGIPYVRWIVAILVITSATIAINDTHYLPLVLQALLPGKELPSPPYDCWQQNILWGNSSLFCGYSSYGELVEKLFWELLPIVITAFPGIWLITSRTAKHYFS
ncbi:MAG: hypothetical protein F6K11_17825 [Leptolyngbya sp. SIO3F4]|nr:hypothetical protein [Leptolyngbya sp. SIO3F4]